jgi:hypothetical protein
VACDDTLLLQLGHEGVSSAAVALSLALRSLTAEGAVFFADAKNPLRAPVRANARLAQSIFLYFEAPVSPAPNNTIPLRRNRSRSSYGLRKLPSLCLVHVSESLLLCAKINLVGRLADQGTLREGRTSSREGFPR